MLDGLSYRKIWRYNNLPLYVTARWPPQQIPPLNFLARNPTSCVGSPQCIHVLHSIHCHGYDKITLTSASLISKQEGCPVSKKQHNIHTCMRMDYITYTHAYICMDSVSRFNLTACCWGAQAMHHNHDSSSCQMPYARNMLIFSFHLKKKVI